MSKQVKLYKVLSRNDRGELVSCNGGTQVWTPGVPVSVEGKLVVCGNGIHLCRPNDLLHWLNEVICPVTKCSKERIVEKDKVVVRWAIIGEPLPTWNEMTTRLFACDCAEWALSLVENPDPRSVKAIRVSRLFAAGKATAAELAAAGAAGTAAWDAAGAAWVAQDTAARAAAAAAWATAGDAGVAAGAAWDAAGAAWDAAGAACDAAGDAWEYMAERLMQYLNGEADDA